MHQAMIQSGVLLVDTILGIYTLIVLLRFLFQLCKVNFYNPLAKFLLVATNPIVLPTRKIIPGLFGMDLASLFLAFCTVVLKLYVILLITNAAASIDVTSLLLVSTEQLLTSIINIFFYAIIITVIASWFVMLSNNQAAMNNPLFVVVNQLVEPILGRIRKVLPSTGGFDLSPLVAIILLQIAKFFLNGIFADIAG